MLDLISGLLFTKKNDMELQNIRIADFLYEYCSMSAKSPDYIKKYTNLARILAEFERDFNKTMYSDSFDETTMEHFIRFLQLKNYRQNAIRYYYQLVLSSLNKIQRAGYHIKKAFPYAIPIAQEEAPAVYFTMQEIRQLLDIPLLQDQAYVRDLFVIGCCTALRYSDYSRLSAENFIDGKIYITTKKNECPLSHSCSPFYTRDYQPQRWIFLLASKSKINQLLQYHDKKNL